MGISSSKKRPMMSPSDDLTSSPTITRRSGYIREAISRASRAPAMELWSVTATHVRPAAMQLLTRASVGMSQSPEWRVWVWKSPLTYTGV